MSAGTKENASRPALPTRKVSEVAALIPLSAQVSKSRLPPAEDTWVATRRSAVIGDRVDHSFAPCFALPRRDLIARLVVRSRPGRCSDRPAAPRRSRRAPMPARRAPPRRRRAPPRDRARAGRPAAAAAVRTITSAFTGTGWCAPPIMRNSSSPGARSKYMPYSPGLPPHSPRAGIGCGVPARNSASIRLRTRMSIPSPPRYFPAPPDRRFGRGPRPAPGI